tara:strand:- start:39 stop:383 length:345 start_codon:yes stop_codon:yes gene_type:complete
MSAIDLSKRFPAALERLGNDTELLRTMASIVAEDGPVLHEQLAADVKRGDLPAVTATAHQLKGLLATFETESPTSMLDEMEQFAKRGDAESVKQLHTRSQPEIVVLLGLISQLA